MIGIYTTRTPFLGVGAWAQNYTTSIIPTFRFDTSTDKYVEADKKPIADLI